MKFGAHLVESSTRLVQLDSLCLEYILYFYLSEWETLGAESRLPWVVGFFILGVVGGGVMGRIAWSGDVSISNTI